MNNKKPKLIQKWTCDACGQEIDGIQSGWVECLSPADSDQRLGLRLVHRGAASPREACRYNKDIQHKQNRLAVLDLPLEEFVGPAGLMKLLEYINGGLYATNELVELTKRLHIPGYEQVRPHLAAAVAEQVIVPNTADGFPDADQIADVLAWVEAGGPEQVSLF